MTQYLKGIIQYLRLSEKQILKSRKAQELQEE